MRYDNILQAIGNTPLVKLGRLAAGLKPAVYVKCEFLNPGGSVKDRIGIAMIEDAERRGLLKPGGTIVEGTSGNTGIGLALAAALKGYKLIFTITDKQSREKINLLKALGAEVVVCPTAVEPDDPRSFYSIAAQLAKEIPNAYYPNQYANPENPRAHYLTTGPEIWKDSGGRVTHFVAGMGTGGTISGIGHFLKEKNPRVKIVGADPIGSIYYEKIKYNRKGRAHPYVVEGIGEDLFPKTMDLSLPDDVVRVSDKDSFVTARRLAQEEGLFVGGSSGAAVWAGLSYAKKLSRDHFMVILLPDTGMRYLSKIYNDEWMRENQYLGGDSLHAKDVLALKKVPSSKASGLVSARPDQALAEALKQMRKRDISQMPVFEGQKLVGAVYEDDILNIMLRGRKIGKMIVREAMGEPLPILDAEARLNAIVKMITPSKPAVLVKSGKNAYQIVTKYDILRTLAHDGKEIKKGA